MYIADMNVLYRAFRASLIGSAWKREPQVFEHDWLYQLSCLQTELNTRTYKTLPGSEFTLCERGKIRHIHGGRIRDRVVRHALCDEVIGPCTKPYLIHNNGASQKGKGVSFARAQFEKDLHNYWLKNGNNDGYIGFKDLSKFYDNIRHDKIKELLYPVVPEENWWLLDEILHNMEVDVSYMSDEEYANCMETKFDSVDYYAKVLFSERTGKRMMAKSVNIGDQLSQDIGVFFPHKIDNYVKIVRGIKCYGRYMDDMYFICKTREEALSVSDGIDEQAAKYGLFINKHKTRIVKLSGNFKYLQVKYTLTETGRVMKRINPKSVSRERRKLKAYKRLLDKGIIPMEDIEQAYRSWMGDYTRIMSKRQVRHMKELFKGLFGKEIRWKRQSNSKTVQKLSQRKTEGASLWLKSPSFPMTYPLSRRGIGRS